LIAATSGATLAASAAPAPVMPVIVGFGIKTPEAARDIAAVADGCVVGSAIVERIGRGDAAADVLAYVASLAAGAHSA
jgi:tryptophan synthase alpha chain